MGNGSHIIGCHVNFSKEFNYKQRIYLV